MTIQYLQSFIAGLLISLTGSLPLGSLNVTAMQIAIKEPLQKAYWFAAGVVIVEVAYLLVTLNIIGKYAINQRLFSFFQLLSVVVLSVMAVGSFRAANKKKYSPVVLNSGKKTLYLGIVMSALNPMQIPFWAGWVIYLLSRSLLTNTIVGYTLFALSAGLGTFIALLIFIFSGKKFSAFMLKHDKKVNTAIGCLFATMAAFQLVRNFDEITATLN